MTKKQLRRKIKAQRRLDRVVFATIERLTGEPYFDPRPATSAALKELYNRLWGKYHGK